MAAVSFSGIASGIDTDALIKATIDALTAQRVTPKQREVDDLTATDTSFGELKTKVTDLQTKLKVFSTLSGGGIAKLGSSSDESVAGATVSNSATNGTYSLTVNTMAQNATLSLGQTGLSKYASSSAVISNTGTVTFNIGSPTVVSTVSVVVGASTTLDQFVSSFNSQTSYAEASVVNAGTASSPDYKIVVSSNSSGLAQGFIAVTDGTGGGFPSTATSQATDASFDIAGVGTITRSSNNVSDVIAGVTFNLKSTGSATISIADDASTTASRVQSFIDAYNEVVGYISTSNQVTRDESSSEPTNIFAPLSKTRIDDNFLSAMRSVVAAVSNPTGATIRVFSELGITTERDGTLKFTSDTFKTALASDSSSVNTMLTSLADTASLTGGTIDTYVRFNGLFDTAVNSNKERISNLSKDISEIKSALAKQQEAMKAQYSRFEALMGSMQQKQQTLTSALAGL
jgi:flagellar hook-associated protein 2